MSYVKYDEFLPEVLPYVRDVPEFVAIRAIRQACIEFCERTTFVREYLPDVTVVKGQPVYDLETIAGTSVVMVIQANIGTHQVKPNDAETLAQIFGGDWRTLSGPVDYILQESYTQVRLVMTPDTEYYDPLKLYVATRPLRKSSGCAGILYERYAEVIGFGARARLHDTPGQPYSDENAAKKFRMWFESGYGQATIAANRGHGRGPTMARPPRFV